MGSQGGLSDLDTIHNAKASNHPESVTTTPTDHGDFCERCRNMDWHRIPSSKEGRLLHEAEFLGYVSGTHQELKDSRCTICRLLATIKPRSMDLYKHCEIWVVQAWELFQYIIRPGSYEKNGMLVVIATPSLGPETRYPWSWIEILTNLQPLPYLAVENDEYQDNSDFKNRRITPDKVDYEAVRDWMLCCQNNHDPRLCRQGSTSPVPGFQVLDCLTEKTVTPPTPCEYVALSYVWGPTKPQGDEARKFPLVVRDSIAVTLSLGFRYLWVDRYCIDQDDNHKHIQISSMDRIYSASVLTIIAAAGADSDYGLPGVSCRHRFQQLHANISGVPLLSVPLHTLQTLPSSVWSTRGWTYQEGFLSRRRLIFTDDQVSFLCNQMYCSESLKQPSDFLLRSSIRHFHNSPVPVFPDPIVSEHLDPGALTGCIETYSCKDLSYNADGLNACLGILSAFAQADDSSSRPPNHLWGVPLELKTQRDRYNSRKSLQKFWRLWLGWHHSAPTKRRPELPSWSWVGWRGAVVCEWEMGEACNLMGFEVEVRLSDNEEFITLSQFVGNEIRRSLKRALQPPTQISPCLQIRGFLIDIEVKIMSLNPTPLEVGETICAPHTPSHLKRSNGPYCLLHFAPNIALLMHISFDAGEFNGTSMRGLLMKGEPSLPEARHPDGVPLLSVMLVRDCGRFYERMGIASCLITTYYCQGGTYLDESTGEILTKIDWSIYDPDDWKTWFRERNGMKEETFLLR